MEERRYYLVTYCGTREKKIETYLEYNKLLEKVRDYSSKSKNDYLMGNVTCEHRPDGMYIVAHCYRKLNFHKLLDPKSRRTAASTISEILDFTTSFSSKEELASFFGDKAIGRKGYVPDINVAYNEDYSKTPKKDRKYDRRIKYLQVMYKNDEDILKDDRRFFSLEFIKKCLKDHVYSRDFGTLKDLCNELCFNNDSLPELEKLRIAIDLCENQNHPLDELYRAAERLIDKYTYDINRRDGSIKRDKQGKRIKSKKRIYDVAEFFKFTGSMNKKHSPVMYNEGPTEEKKKELKRIEEEQKVMELIKRGINPYEQMSLF